MKRTKHTVLVSFVLGACAVAGCSQSTGGRPAYEPGFGELMTLTQTRHAKLWFAGEAQNWPLASYELDELKEGFDDLVRFHPMFKDLRQPVGHLVATMVDPSLTEVAEAIKAEDAEHFTKAYDRLTAGCNACHTEAKFGFNVVVRPTTNPFSNQSFAPPK
jgi:hypothetical protein